MKTLIKNEIKSDSTGDILRFWRKLNRVSQLDLALDAGISSRHISFVESGKSRPSRDLVLKISHVLKMPLRQRNALLKATGYAAEFSEAPLDGEKMEIVRQALQRMIGKHEPYPAFVINSAYEIIMINKGFEQFIHFFAGKTALLKYSNVMRLLFAEDGLRKHVINWSTIEPFLISRLWEEAISTQNSDLIKLYNDISLLQSNRVINKIQIENDLPFMSLKLKKHSGEACFFTTITTLGTPLDLTTQELRIESLFPADENTKKLFPMKI